MQKLIAKYVKADPSAFYTAEQFDTAVKTLKSFCKLRAKSIRKQLSGGLAAETGAQSAEDRVKVGSLDISSMGMMNNGQPEGQGQPQGQEFPSGPMGAPPEGQGVPGQVPQGDFTGTPPQGQTDGN